MTEVQDEKMVGTSVVAKMVGITPTTVLRYAEHGILIPDAILQQGKIAKRLYKQETIQDFLEKCGIIGMLDEEMYSPAEAADICGVSRNMMRSYIETGEIIPDAILPSIRDGRSGRRRFKASTVADFKRSLDEDKRRLM